MILIKDLSISYGKDKKVIQELNLSFQNDCIHGIVGLNGSGKTTLLHCLFGLLKKDEGVILFEGRKISKKDMAYLPTENFFYSRITAREYLAIFKNDSFDLEKWNSLFLLPLDEVIDNFSTGMKKKLAFLSLLKTDKPIMILDEPFNGLDLETSRIIRSVLLNLKEKGKTIIVTSHILETLTNMCDYIHYLHEGNIEQSRAKDEFDDLQNEIFSSIEDKNKGLIDSLLK